MNNQTVVARRTIPDGELIALIMVQALESGMQLAIQILGEASRGPMGEAPARIDRAITLLSHLAGETHTREIADARSQVTADIDATVKQRLAEINSEVDQTLKARDERP